MTGDDTAEHRRLAETTGRADDDLFSANPWYEWGPYLSERAWGTVREDYSADGDAWSSFPHDHARSRAYRWNEDGMAGISDIRHELCLGLALWNGRDPILKERMFGLTGPQGNHGEDAKEYWWYLEGLPSHALLQWRYHYPQAEFPYERLVEENARRGLTDFEFELMDTGVFDEGRYWSVDVTYAKASATELYMSIEATNHGPLEATLHVLPTLWFRNTWRWSQRTDLPSLSLDADSIAVEHPRLGGYRLQAAPGADGSQPRALFCDNETNLARLYGASRITAFPKDGINDHVVGGADTVNPDQRGTKAAFWYQLTVPAGGTRQVRLRLHRPQAASPWDEQACDRVIAARRRDADEFYTALGPDLDEERMRVLRQAAAGLVWSKQMYPYRVSRWLDGDPAGPPPPESHRHIRNAGWRHLDAFDVLAMPDPWEYPWFAAWDLAFHAIAWAHLDPAFAKYQLTVLLREWFQHPNGALPAYEWNFDDVNPPVHALAALRVFVLDGSTDTAFLERVFQKLLLNFTWWLNRQDADGNNLFGGGFLGLDNISPVDRSHLPDGVRIEQADGTAWMAAYSLAMSILALLLANENPVYDDMVVKFLEQFVMISEALEASGLYDADDGFFYDRLIDAAGNRTPVKVQTLVGVIPILATVGVPLEQVQRLASLRKAAARRLDDSESDEGQVFPIRESGGVPRAVVSLVTPEQARRTLTHLLDEGAFLSPHGLRSLSRRHAEPYAVPGLPGATIDYEPAESTTSMYGGNSNWRGPVWMPTNYLVVRSLLLYDELLGPDFTVEHPTGSGRQHTLREVATDLADRLIGIWLPDGSGRRPVSGGQRLLAEDPAWKDNLLFYEYFHGDNGAGLGASHQTGWTALVVDLLLDPPSRARKVFGRRFPPAG
ncbi:glucosidase [Terrabacter terrae]|uniref:Glucosidase n=1 Tax=Terrabacter terrae TaxID=318434 RepID=A0ABP5FGG7_9MICO